MNTNELEPVYHYSAKAVLDGKALKPSDIFETLQAIYVLDGKFEKDFESKELSTIGQRKKLVKYILYRLESDASGVARDFEVDAGSIEHILPENPSSAWSECFEPDRQKDFIYRLGNLTLLEPSLNRDVGNNLLKEKLPVYEKSQYQLTQNLVNSNLAEWTPAALNKRQQELSRRATHIWRSDFA